MTHAERLYDLYKSCQAHAVPAEEAKDIIGRITQNRAAYEEISKSLGGKIPYWFIGALHYRENTAMSPRAYLGNGQLIIGSSAKTSIAPRGRGPFKTFQEGAKDILHFMGFDKFQTWSTKDCLVRTEIWNGMGYANLGPRVVNPYLFAGTTAYVSGKFIADGQYSSIKVDKEIGVAVLMKSLALS